MKKSGSILFFVLLLCQTNWAQNSQLVFHSEFEKSAFEKTQKIPFELFLASDPEVTSVQFTSFQNHLDNLVGELSLLKNKANDDLKFLEKAFYKIHRKELGWYENYISLSQTFENKKYDCLTGTALFALILDQLDIEYEILEFDFHIFLLAKANGNQVLMEATDPINGFVTDNVAIQDRIQNAELSVEVSIVYNKTYQKNVIDLTSLAGLQYYNLAVDLFNKKEFKKASLFIQKADLLYGSERIKNTRDLITSASL